MKKLGALFSVFLVSLFIAVTSAPLKAVGFFDGDYLVDTAIDQVLFTKNEASSFTCVSSSGTYSSLIKRLLAFIGVAKTIPNDTNDSCKHYTGSGGHVFMGTDESYTLTPDLNLRQRQFTGFAGSERHSRTDTAVTAPRYGSEKCITTHTYFFNSSNTSKSGGEIKKSCPPTTSPATSPPFIPVGPEKGTFTAKWKYPQAGAFTVENYTVSVNSRSQLVFNGHPSKRYKIVVSASAQQLTLNKKNRMFGYKDIPCASISVAGRKLDSSCQMTLEAQGPAATFDVTPTVSVPYYLYTVSNNTPQEIEIAPR